MDATTIIQVTPDQQGMNRVEIVERKGIGHPDTICDALAEELSRALSQFYLEETGLILHHNVDKALLWGGTSRPEFGGGNILEPMEIFLAGRATCQYNGTRLPLDELVQKSCTNWLRSHVHALDPESHVKIHSLIRPGSPELIDLYRRQEKTGIAMANDTSCGVGYAPLSDLERTVLQVEKYLNSSDVKSTHPEIGEDIKVMGIRKDDRIELTVACAFIDRYIHNIDDYVDRKTRLQAMVKESASMIANASVNVQVNAADDIENSSIYLTVTGTSAESGDDGEVGRGNRVNGLITPYRPMNMEAVAGKNPVTHVGKLYNIIAQQIADTLVYDLEGVKTAYCYLVSRIGSPINQPQVVDLRLSLDDGIKIDEIKAKLNEIVEEKLASSTQIRKDLISGILNVY